MRRFGNFKCIFIELLQIKLVQHFKFAGVFLNFTLGDDISEACNCGKFPLVRTISEELLAGGRCKVEGCLV